MTEPELLEYESLREESHHARSAQQAILQWSLGAFALIFAGALTTSERIGPGFERLRMAVFGFALPVFVIGSCLAWAGELIRMERVGFYLRGRERAFWREPHGTQIDGSCVPDRTRYPLLWENFIASGGHKQWAGYGGAALIYGGAYVISFTVFLLTLWAHRFDGHATAWRIGGIAYAAMVTLVCAWVFGDIARRTLRLGRQTAGMPDTRGS